MHESIPAPTPPDDGASYLLGLGQRVRRFRARRGISRRGLAAASGVSERYLAQLEGGTGNASILILKAVAAAMHVALDDLVDESDTQSADYLLLRERLRRASPGELHKLATGLRSSVPRTPSHIALIGLRGAGKSTLGRALATALRVPFVELVQEIEREAGMAVSEIFSLGGQTTYRRLEREALSAALTRFDRAVIATGGSLVSEPETYELLLDACYTVWLQAEPPVHMQRVVAQGDHRPMADNGNAMADLKRILAERTALYARADTSINTSALTPAATLAAVLELDAVCGLKRAASPSSI